MKTLIGKIALGYARCMPNHRGRFRALVILDRLFGPFRLRTPAGPVLEVYLSSIMDLSYFRKADSAQEARHSIDDAAPRLIAGLKSGECFIDVGANIGYLSLLASRFVGQTGRVVAIEPSPREYVRLLRGITLNGAANVVPVNGALGTSAASMSLEVSPCHTGLNRLVLSDATRTATAEPLISVPVWAADSLLPPLVAGREVGLVKIDTEGAEVLVLRGMRRFLTASKPRRVVVEVTPRYLVKFDTEKGEIYRIMKDLGYQPKLCSDDWQYDEIFERQ